MRFVELVKAIKVWHWLAATATLLILAIFVWPGLYIYVETNGYDVIRVNRFTGVREYATDYGWMTQVQLDRKLEENPIKISHS